LFLLRSRRYPRSRRIVVLTDSTSRITERIRPSHTCGSIVEGALRYIWRILRRALAEAWSSTSDSGCPPLSASSPLLSQPSLLLGSLLLLSPCLTRMPFSHYIGRCLHTRRCSRCRSDRHGSTRSRTAIARAATAAELGHERVLLREEGCERLGSAYSFQGKSDCCLGAARESECRVRGVGGRVVVCAGRAAVG